MAATAEAGNFGAAKLGGWLGWAQRASGRERRVTLADMKSLNAKWLTADVAAVSRDVTPAGED